MKTKEIDRTAIPGPVMLLVEIAALAVSIVLFVNGIEGHSALRAISGVVLFVLVTISLGGFFVVQPNEAKVLVLFGNYKGSVKKNGWWWVNPFTSRPKISMRVRNFVSDKLKVNDLTGNPIEIAAVIVWRVHDTYAAKLSSTTSRTSCRCRPNRRCATWRAAIRTTNPSRARRTPRQPRRSDQR
jgi:regulator of protease activity HflC (stomatin/prohibitin superfamily)